MKCQCLIGYTLNPWRPTEIKYLVVLNNFCDVVSVTPGFFMLCRGPLKLLKTKIYKIDDKFQYVAHKMHLITGMICVG